MELEPRQLLTTRTRTAFAVGLTALVLTQTIRGLYLPHSRSAWLLGAPPHGWTLVAVNVALYAYICWLAFWFIRGTAGKERVFIVGWFVDSRAVAAPDFMAPIGSTNQAHRRFRVVGCLVHGAGTSAQRVGICL